MARPAPTEIEEWLAYGAARLAAAGLGALGPAANLHLATALGRLGHAVAGKHRQRLMDNLRLAFPEQAQDQSERMAKACFENFFRLLVETLLTPRLIQPDTWGRHIHAVNLGQAIPRLGRGKPAILITGHLGNWEVLGSLLAVLGYPVTALARPLNHRLVNDWLLGIRESKGMRVLTKWDATDTMVEIMESGGALGFIADQNAGDKGLFVPFFGKLASWYKSIALLAMRYEAPVICGYACRSKTAGPGEFRFDVGVGEVILPAEWASQPDPVFYITARYARALETMIRAYPEQYLWMHRRWKSRPRHEREGKPMPASLREKLLALPWMDAATMASLEAPL